jgi:hypothetical protein
VKVGGKEYTQAELEKLLSDRAARSVAPAPTQPASAQAFVPPSPEEIAKKETEWCANYAKAEKISFPLSKDEMETVLSGGDEAVALLGTKLTEVCSKAVLLARKSIYDDMNPTLARIESNLHPLVNNNVQIEAVAAEQQFMGLYPDLKGHLDTVRQVGDALLKQYPNECAAMTREALLAEVASQTDRILQTEFKRWQPNSAGTWRDAGKAAPAAKATSAAKATFAAPATPAPARAPIRAPASNSPAGSLVGGASPDWQKSVAKSLAD